MKKRHVLIPLTAAAALLSVPAIASANLTPINGTCVGGYAFVESDLTGWQGDYRPPTFIRVDGVESPLARDGDRLYATYPTPPARTVEFIARDRYGTFSSGTFSTAPCILPPPPPPPPPVPPKPRRPLLTVKKTGPTVLVPGRRAVYLITIKNLGTGTAHRVILRDLLPAGLVFADSRADSRAVGNIRAGQVRYVRIPVHVLTSASGRLCNTVRVQSVTDGRRVSSTKCSGVASIPPVPRLALGVAG